MKIEEESLARDELLRLKEISDQKDFNLKLLKDKEEKRRIELEKSQLEYLEKSKIEEEEFQIFQNKYPWIKSKNSQFCSGEERIHRISRICLIFDEEDFQKEKINIENISPEIKKIFLSNLKKILEARETEKKRKIELERSEELMKLEKEKNGEGLHEKVKHCKILPFPICAIWRYRLDPTETTYQSLEDRLPVPAVIDGEINFSAMSPPNRPNEGPEIFDAEFCHSEVLDSTHKSPPRCAGNLQGILPERFVTEGAEKKNH